MNILETHIPTNNFDLFKNYLPYKIVKYNGKYYLMTNIFMNDQNTIFGDNIYFTIDEKFCEDYEGNEIYNFLSNLEYDDFIFDRIIHGVTDLVIGIDYFISGETSGISLPNDLDQFDDLSDIKIKDIDNIAYFIHKNNNAKNTFSEDELNQLNATFMKQIIKYSPMYKSYKDTLDFVYKNVIDYYANGQYDDATVLMNSIFNTTLTTTTATSSCNCNTQTNCSSGSTSYNTINTGTSTINIDTATCLDKYKAAMYQWLLQMLSDVNFYCNWMFVTLEENDNITVPNEILLDALIDLLTDFLNAGYDLSNLRSTCKTGCGCGHSKSNNSNSSMSSKCSDLSGYDSSSNGSCTNENIISNYIKVLNWVKNDEINENKNKIYLYGKQFAEIFPLLSF